MDAVWTEARYLGKAGWWWVRLCAAGCWLLLIACLPAGWLLLAAAGDEVLKSKLFGVRSRDAIGAPVQEHWLAGWLAKLLLRRNFAGTPNPGWCADGCRFCAKDGMLESRARCSRVKMAVGGETATAA